MTASQAVFVHSELLERYGYPESCPFNTTRAAKARATLAGMGLLGTDALREAAPEPAPRETLETFHEPRYLDVLARAAEGFLDEEGLFMGLGTPDTPVFQGLYEYAAMAAGATLLAADTVSTGAAHVAFNPSGGYHHAFPRRAAGFCYINDMALACLRLADAGRRVLYLDIDAHHGDGVQAAFYHRSDVMTVSFHEGPRTLFPGTGFADEIGEGEGRGYAVNVPLPVHVYDDAYVRAFREIALPLLGAYDPDIILLEIGMDCLAGDPLTHLELTNNAYADVLRLVRETGRPIAAAGGGGYHVENSARGWALAWAVLTDSGGAAEDDLSLGLGGVMMATTDYLGGLRDRRLAPEAAVRDAVDVALEKTIERVKRNVFELHGL